jgi:isocitrate dehydrogenase (NAD+)
MLIAYATVQSDIFKPTKFGGKYTVTLIPGTHPAKASTKMVKARAQG